MLCPTQKMVIVLLKDMSSGSITQDMLIEYNLSG